MNDINTIEIGVDFIITIIFPFLIARRMVTGHENPKSKQYKKKIVKSTIILVALGLVIDIIIEAFSGYFIFNIYSILGSIIGRFCIEYLICDIAFWEVLNHRSRDKSNIDIDNVVEEINTITMVSSDVNKEQTNNSIIGENVESESTTKEIETTLNEHVDSVKNDNNPESMDERSTSYETEENDGGFEIEKIISNSDSPLLRRAMLFIEEKNWERANSHIEQELDRFPENGKAYLLSLFSDSKSTNFDELILKSKNVVSTSKFKLAKRFEDDKTIKFIQAIENATLSKTSDKNEKSESLKTKATLEKYKSIIAVLSLCLVICASVTVGMVFQLKKLSNVEKERDSYKAVLETMYFNNLVFTFDGDNYYHRYGCPQTPMAPTRTDDYNYSCYEKTDAEAAGYKACTYCFGYRNKSELQKYERFFIVGNV